MHGVTVKIVFSVVGMQQIVSKKCLMRVIMCIICTTSKGKDSAKAHNEV